MTMQTTTPVEIRHFHLFCGLGGGARGFNRASPRVGNLQAKFRCLGGIDVDAASIRDFGRLAGVPGTVLDLFDREQYRTFHGAEPPADWREATAADIQRAAGGERPNIVFLSAPCKGFSGLLSEGKSKTDKYQALNRLTLRGVWLMLEAWSDDPPELVIFENVPRIATRGRHLLDQIVALLRAYGYAVAETTHDCGEIGGLAQSRRRFLLVARHAEKVPSFLYQPRSKPLRAVGDVLGRMLLPGDLRAGPMHRVPSLQWKTWVRLAFVQAGSDWRSLNRLAIEDGTLRDYLIVPEMHAGMLGVQDWTRHSSTLTGKGRPSCGNFAVADPRFEQSALWKDGQAYGVRSWDTSTGTVAGQQGPGQGAYSVADPRHHGPAKHSNEYRVVRWDRAAMAVTSAHGTGQAVADPRSGMDAERTAYTTGGHYGVVPWDGQAGAVSGAACHDNGRWSVADPRMPAAADKLVCRIVSEDGTWHRPFTTLELAHLQSLVEPDELLELDGTSDQAKRERIGNAVPSEAGEAIAHVMGETLLLALSGETFILSAQPVWVRPIALGLAMGTTA
ncbi:DNA cytosine methyltransferase [Delftia acidovorans]|uniref:DNA cytosine methyltransferase n=1 Tax=Delftia acidovorans TaxID=80866 RepID=UPI003D0FD98C